MAKTRPSLGGIFRLKGKNDPKIQLTGMSTYGNHNPASSPTGDSQYTPKFSLFGNYKPKIFNSNENANPSANSEKSNGPKMKRDSTSGNNPKDGASKQSLNEHYIVPTFSGRSGDKDNGTTMATSKSNIKSKGNFILMGDKDKPMLLETGDELPDELPGGDNQQEASIKESISAAHESTSAAGKSTRAVEESTSAVKESTSVNAEPSETRKPEPKEETEVGKMDVDDVDSINSSYERSHYVKVDQPNRAKMSREDAPMEAPYIPPPDYDEEVLTIDMPDEEDIHEAHPSELRGLSSRRVYRVYQGDDFGQYLQEEDSIYQTPSARSARRDIKRQPKRPRAKKQTKTSKSITGTISRVIFGSRHNEDPMDRRTIHDVSYGTSKMGNSKGKPNGVQGSRTEGRYFPANGVHSPNNNRQSNYEQFLNSRHTTSGSLESTSDSDMDTGDDNINTGNMDSRNNYLATTGAYSSPNRYTKKNGIWEKLTLRFRRLSRGEIGTVN